MTEVLFRGEYVEESHANLILARESNPNTPEYKRRLEEQTQAEEQRKKLQQQKRAESKLKEKRYKNTS
jgi:ABC-type glutathione transport system ATPase component